MKKKSDDVKCGNLRLSLTDKYSILSSYAECVNKFEYAVKDLQRKRLIVQTAVWR